MIYVAASIVALASILGIALTLVTLPGIWLAIAVAMLCWWWQPDLFSLWTIAVAIGLGVLAEIAELASSSVGAAKRGGSKTGAMGALFGSLIGALAGTVLLPIPIVGTIAGGIIGAALGALFAERGVKQRTWRESSSIATGAAIGRAFATVIKGAFAAAIAGLLTVAAFYP